MHRDVILLGSNSNGGRGNVFLLEKKTWEIEAAFNIFDGVFDATAAGVIAFVAVLATATEEFERRTEYGLWRAEHAQRIEGERHLKQ